MNFDDASKLLDQLTDVFLTKTSPLEGLVDLAEEVLTGPVKGALEWLSDNVAALGLTTDAAGEWFIRAYLKSGLPADIQQGLQALSVWGDVQMVVSGAFQFLGGTSGGAAPTVELRVGDTIGLISGPHEGRVGAFVKSAAYSTMLLTCAHVLSVDASASPSMRRVEEGVMGQGIGSVVAEADLDSDDDLTGDWALATVEVPIASGLPGALGKLQPKPIAATQGMPVARASLSQQLAGTIEAISVRVSVQSNLFVNQLIVSRDDQTPFAGQGDSGTLVVVSSGPSPRAALGMVFANSVQITSKPDSVNVVAVMPLVDLFNSQQLTFIT